ncbi:FadR/GntR family transcriptional regulator [Pseudooceanicola sp.]|uniref:FadR/GntR family transcriptional regulator n=1 Tax=Pseudooceanicola sp. TaxID=1914328 RepID=UPI00351258A1
MKDPRPMKIEPLKREGLASMVIAKILEEVKMGNLSKGDRLPSERHLAEMFNISRPTIREALRGLSLLGVVESNHGGGVFVTSLEASNLLQPLTFFLALEGAAVEKLYDARRLIEGELAALAAQNATPKDIGVLQGLIEIQSKRLGDAEAYRLVDAEFHQYLAQLAQNPFLARAAESLFELGNDFRKIASESTEVLSGSVADHKAILKAVEAGDAEAARVAMVAHMNRVFQTTSMFIESRDDQSTAAASEEKS